MSEKSLVETPAYQEKAVIDASVVAASATPTGDDSSSTEQRPAGRPPPLKIKIMAILMVSAISFGSQWSSGVTGAMKSTIKKVERDSFHKTLQSNKA